MTRNNIIRIAIFLVFCSAISFLFVSFVTRINLPQIIQSLSLRSKTRLIAANGSGKSEYYIDGDGKYYHGESVNFGRYYSELSVDRESFQVMGRRLAKDKDQVFYQARTIKKAHAESFKIIQDGPKFILDSSDIYIENTPDLSTAYRERRKEGDFSTDKNNIYFNDEIIAENVYENLEYIATNILKIGDKLIVGSRNSSNDYIKHEEFDVNSFVPYSEHFFADEENVFCYSHHLRYFHSIKNIDRKAFKYSGSLSEKQNASVFEDGKSFYYYSSSDNCVKTALDTL